MTSPRRLISFGWVNQFDDIARDRLDEWIYFLKNEEIKDDFTAQGLQEAKTKLDVMKLAEAERRAYERWQEDLHYQASLVLSNYGIGKLEGRKEGLDEGRKEGRQGALHEVARRLKSAGEPVERISALTGLSAGEIAGL
jgi:predicted transposase/invertase (TIGR01784 family)